MVRILTKTRSVSVSKKDLLMKANTSLIRLGCSCFFFYLISNSFWVGLKENDFQGHFESALVNFARVRTKNQIHHELGAELEVLVLNHLSSGLDFEFLHLAVERSLQIFFQVNHSTNFLRALTRHVCVSDQIM